MMALLSMVRFFTWLDLTWFEVLVCGWLENQLSLYTRFFVVLYALYLTRRFVPIIFELILIDPFILLPSL